jgi:hypothetical protein
MQYLRISYSILGYQYLRVSISQDINILGYQYLRISYNILGCHTVS